MQQPERFDTSAVAAAGGDTPRGSLTSEPDLFSEAAWDLLLASQDQARRWRHDQMDVEHLLQALLQDSRFAAWVDPLPIERERLLDRLEGFCAEQPSSPGDDLYIGDALEDLLEEADRRRSSWGSRLLDIPHLLLALLDEPRLGAALLAEEGLSEPELLRQLRPAAAPAPRPAGIRTAPAAGSGRPRRFEAPPAPADDWIDSPSQEPAARRRCAPRSSPRATSHQACPSP